MTHTRGLAREWAVASAGAGTRGAFRPMAVGGYVRSDAANARTESARPRAGGTAAKRRSRTMTAFTLQEPPARRRRRRPLLLLLGLLGVVGVGAGQLSLALFTDTETVDGVFSSGSIILDAARIDALT